MFKRLKRLFSRPATTAQADVEPLSDEDILREYFPPFPPPAESIDALVELVRLVASTPEDAKVTRLVARARSGEEPGDSIECHLRYALYDADEALPGR